MSTPPVQPTQAPDLVSAVRQSDGSIFFTWENDVPSSAQTYSAITVHQRVGGLRPQINSLGYPAISNQQYWQYSKYGGGAFNPGEAYTISLRAHGPAGSSGYSNEITVPAMETPEPTFTSVERTSLARATAVIAQNPNAPATVDAVYVYVRKQGTGPWGNSVNRTTSASQTELSIPVPNGLDTFEAVLRSHGPAGWSDYSTVRTINPWWQEPSAVGDLQATRDPITGDVALTWAAGGTARAPRVTIEIQRAAGEVGQFARVASLPGTRTSYTDTSGVDTRDYRYRVIVHSHAGTAAATTGNLPATVLVPGAPSNVDAVYAATNQVTATWTRTVSIERPVTAQQVGWQDESAVPEDPNAWTWISVGSTATSRTFSVGANKRVRVTVRASNAAGVSELAAPSDLVTTTPAGPASLSAGWSGDDIVVSIPAYTSVGDRLVLEFTTDGSTWFPAATLATTTRSWTHTAPTKTVPHTYQAWVESDATGTPDSATVTSNTVAGLTKPAPPTVLQPEVLDATVDIPVAVVHNPLDGSALTEGWLEHRAVGAGTWSSVYFTSGQPVIPAGTYTNGVQVELRAQTAGQSGEASDWSTPISFTTRARPVPVLTGPPALVTARTASTTWTATGQTSATVELLDSNGLVLEVREVNDALTREVPWATELQDNGSYSTRLVMRDAYQASLPVVRAFTVDIVSPPKPSLSGAFDPEPATVAVDITGSAGERLELWRLDRDGVWRPIGERAATGTGVASITDPLPPLAPVKYRARAYNADGGWTDSDVVEVDATSRDAILSFGPGWSQMVRGGKVDGSGTGGGRDSEVHQHVGGRTYAYQDEDLQPITIARTVQLLPATGAASYDAWIAALGQKGRVAYREPGGLTVIGNAQVDGWDPGSRFRSAVSFAVTAVDE